MKAMILAAGLGTRLKPWTNTHPKALAPVNGKSLLQRNVEYLQQFGINEVVVNVHHFAGQIIEAVQKNNGWGSSIEFSDETACVLETGGGLMKAATLLDNEADFILINVDILTNLDLNEMIKFHKKNKCLATLATSTRATSRNLLFDSDNNLCGWRNIKTMEERGKLPLAGNEVQKAFNGLHVISSSIFQLISQRGRFSMVDVYLSLMQFQVIKSYNDKAAAFIDVGKPESIVMAEKMFQ